MLRFLTTLLVAVFTFTNAGLSSAHAQKIDAQKMAEGAKIYNDNCMRCHNARSPMERDDQGWATIVAHMRARGNLTRSAAAAVLVYLRASNRPESRQDQGGSAQRREADRDAAAGEIASNVHRERSVTAGSGLSVLSSRKVQALRRFLSEVSQSTQVDSGKKESPTSIRVEMVDKGGNTWRFDPANVEVRRGDTLRFVQKDVVPHNVEFTDVPGDAEMGETEMGRFLTEKGETYEVVIDGRFSRGEYQYVCTPHVAQGMKGTVTVVASDPPTPD